VKEHRRRQFIVAVPFQVRYIAFRVILLMILALALWILVFYPLQLQVITEILDTSRVMSDSSLLIPSPRVLGGLVAVFALMGALAVFESHRIAGPIYRVEKVMHALIAGELPQRIALRRGDNFSHLVPVLNALAARFEAAVRAERLLREILGPRLDELEALCAGDGTPEQVRTRIEELQKGLRQAL